eukprot:TRINITY_DN5648_c0_g1_i2.p1 TRINITY_DN5648_c0_g1~~TRINITY_DN5648_c0_g1_i2.p1  ORF type:complete len:1278 (+),score=316.46 TRINITY_DN5648_c0_g1_i2:71-3835(+)
MPMLAGPLGSGADQVRVPPGSPASPSSPSRLTAVSRTVEVCKNENGKIGMGFHGTRVGEVLPGGPADVAGVQPGMTLRVVNGHTIQSQADATAAFAAAPRRFHMTVDEELPRGWTVHIDQRTGRTFYYHAAVKRSQWTHPAQRSAAPRGSPFRVTPQPGSAEGPPDPAPRYESPFAGPSLRAAPLSPASNTVLYESPAMSPPQQARAIPELAACRCTSPPRRSRQSPSAPRVGQPQAHPPAPAHQPPAAYPPAATSPPPAAYPPATAYAPPAVSTAPQQYATAPRYATAAPPAADTGRQSSQAEAANQELRDALARKEKEQLRLERELTENHRRRMELEQEVGELRARGGAGSARAAAGGNARELAAERRRAAAHEEESARLRRELDAVRAQADRDRAAHRGDSSTERERAEWERRAAEWDRMRAEHERQRQEHERHLREAQQRLRDEQARRRRLLTEALGSNTSKTQRRLYWSKWLRFVDGTRRAREQEQRMRAAELAHRQRLQAELDAARREAQERARAEAEQHAQSMVGRHRGELAELRGRLDALHQASGEQSRRLSADEAMLRARLVSDETEWRRDILRQEATSRADAHARRGHMSPRSLSYRYHPKTLAALELNEAEYRKDLEVEEAARRGRMEERHRNHRMELLIRRMRLGQPGSLGIEFQERGFGHEHNMVITTVVPGGPAEEAGLRAGDKLLYVRPDQGGFGASARVQQKQFVTNIKELMDALGGADGAPNRRLRFGYFRQDCGEQETRAVSLETNTALVAPTLHKLLMRLKNDRDYENMDVEKVIVWFTQPQELCREAYLHHVSRDITDDDPQELLSSAVEGIVDHLFAYVIRCPALVQEDLDRELKRLQHGCMQWEDFYPWLKRLFRNAVQRATHFAMAKSPLSSPRPGWAASDRASYSARQSVSGRRASPEPSPSRAEARPDPQSGANSFGLVVPAQPEPGSPYSDGRPAQSSRSDNLRERHPTAAAPAPARGYEASSSVGAPPPAEAHYGGAADAHYGGAADALFGGASESAERLEESPTYRAPDPAVHAAPDAEPPPLSGSPGREWAEPDAGPGPQAPAPAPSHYEDSRRGFEAASKTRSADPIQACYEIDAQVAQLEQNRRQAEDQGYSAAAAEIQGQLTSLREEKASLLRSGGRPATQDSLPVPSVVQVENCEYDCCNRLYRLTADVYNGRAMWSYGDPEDQDEYRVIFYSRKKGAWYISDHLEDDGFLAATSSSELPTHLEWSNGVDGGNTEVTEYHE